MPQHERHPPKWRYGPQSKEPDGGSGPGPPRVDEDSACGRKREVMSFNAPATEPGRFGPGPDGSAGASHRRSTNGLAIATLVVGVVGFLVFFFPVFFVLGFVAFVW